MQKFAAYMLHLFATLVTYDSVLRNSGIFLPLSVSPQRWTNGRLKIVAL